AQAQEARKRTHDRRGHEETVPQKGAGRGEGNRRKVPQKGEIL
ncbi:MAG: hypothetical protein AVDCRST_MAG01-01-1148, partial [uncultured Rubrobacteraceae bacterium]